MQMIMSMHCKDNNQDEKKKLEPRKRRPKIEIE